MFTECPVPGTAGRGGPGDPGPVDSANGKPTPARRRSDSCDYQMGGRHHVGLEGQEPDATGLQTEEWGEGACGVFEAGGEARRVLGRRC